MLRRLNIARVLGVIRQSGPMTRQEIGLISGLSKPTINEAVDVLASKGLILIEKSEDTNSVRPGPRAQKIFYHSQRKRVIGIDLGGSKIRLLMTDLNGEELTSVRVSTPLQGGRKAIIQAIRDLVLETLASHEMQMYDVGAIVVGTPGIIDPNTGMVSVAPQLPEWENVSLSHELYKILGTEVIVENEAHLAVYGENWRGGAQNLRDVAVMSIGVGIGLGLLIDGKVYRGFNGGAGEIGNLPLSGHFPTSYPPIGTYEFYTGAAGIERNFELGRNEFKAKYLLNLAKGGRVTAESIYRAFNEKDPFSIELVSHQLESIALGIASVCCIVNPEVFIITGGLAPALEPHIEAISAIVRKFAPVTPRIILSALDDLAPAFGALRISIEDVERRTLQTILSGELEVDQRQSQIPSGEK